jgi:calcium/proton exchanger cax
LRQRLFYYSLVTAVAASAITHYTGMSAILQFVISGIAIVFVAGFLGKATESVAHYAGERIGGFLNATFGNAAELIIAIVLIQQAVNGKPHLFEMVKASITGSIIGSGWLEVQNAKFQHQACRAQCLPHDFSCDRSLHSGHVRTGINHGENEYT